MAKTTKSPIIKLPGMRYQRPNYKHEMAARIVGGYLVLVAAIGICLNVFMFFHFLSLEKLSFYILCTSKTLTNTMSLLFYLCYIGPVHLFFTSIGSMFLNARLQQIFGFGLFFHGPMTEFLITVNRFLIIIFTPTNVPKYSNRVTVAALAVIWIIAVWWSTLPGFPEQCFTPFGFDHVGYYHSDCNQEIVMWGVLLIFPLAIFNNTMNIILAIKLAVSVKRQKFLSSEVAKNRRRQTIRFFIQSMIQDWLTAIVAGSNMFLASIFCDLHACVILTSFSIDSLAYGIDGFIMFLFNHKSSKTASKVHQRLETSSQMFPTRTSSTI